VGLFWKRKTDAEFQRELGMVADIQEGITEEEFEAQVEKEQEILRKEGMVLFRALIKKLCSEDKNTIHKLSRELKRKVGWRKVLMHRLDAKCWSDVNLSLEEIIDEGDFDTFFEDVWEPKHLSALGLEPPNDNPHRDKPTPDKMGLKWSDYSNYISAVERAEKQRKKFLRGDYDNSGIFRKFSSEKGEIDMSVGVKFLDSIGIKTSKKVVKKATKKATKKNQLDVDRNAWIDILQEIYAHHNGTIADYSVNVKNALKHHEDTDEYELRIRKNNLPLMFGKKSSLFFSGDVMDVLTTLEKLTLGMEEGQLDGSIRSHRIKVNKAKKNAPNEKILSDIK
jgi:hypothetical protein